MKISLALSGGAARGAFHLGVLQALEENMIEPVAISGSSIGAIIATSYAAGVSPLDQLDIFRSKAFKKAFKFNFFKSGLLRIDRQQSILRELVPIDDISQTDIKLHITTIDLESGHIVRFSEGDAMTLCIASAAVVPLFHPIRYRNYQLVDGGIMDNLPVTPLQAYGFPIFGVDLHPDQKGFTDTMGGIIKRTIFLMWRASVQSQKKACDLYISHPDLSRYSLFRFKNLKEMFQLGYETTLPLTDY